MIKIKQEDSIILIRILSYYKSHTSRIVTIFVCILVTSLIGMLFPLISKTILDSGLEKRNISLVIKLSLLIIALVLASEGIGIFQAVLLSRLNELVTYTLEKTAFKKILRLKINYFKNTHFSEIMNNIRMDIRNASRITDKGSFYIISEIFRCLSGIVGLLIISWKVTIIIILLLPSRYLIIKYLSRKRRRLFEKQMDQIRNYSSWYGDILLGIREVKLWCIDRVMLGQFIRQQKKIIGTRIVMAFVDRINQASESIVYQLITSLIYIVGAYLILRENCTIGGLFALVTYSVYVTGPVSVILNMSYSFSEIIPSAKRLFQFFDMEEEDCISSKNVKRLDAGSVKGDFRFNDVHFSYAPDLPVLKGVSFEIRQGEKVALLGLNGAGKSTIVNLLLRLIKPDTGQITLDGVDINEIQIRDYRKQISVVSQDTYLFNTSIENNISSYLECDGDTVQKAALKSGAHEFIKKLPQKYQSRVGTNGSGLSGGQRQKISVARALIKKSCMLILDEPTSFYDKKSEINLYAVLQNEYTDESVLVISHDTEILSRVNRILILENGCIADEGTLHDLYKRNAFFKNLIDSSKVQEKAG